MCIHICLYLVKKHKIKKLKIIYKREEIRDRGEGETSEYNHVYTVPVFEPCQCMTY